MTFIEFNTLDARLPAIKQEYQSKTPFRYVVFEDFFPLEIAESIHASYPVIEDGEWDGTTYTEQNNKFQKKEFDDGSTMDSLFKEFNSYEFLDWLQRLTEIEEPLLADDELHGGGLHQSTNGAFLNVHVDFNVHPKTKFHRRINALVYMNKNWKDEYQGHLELWDFTDGKKRKLETIAPSFNRCVIFETNEISYHGHPAPLRTPKKVCRKSLATYYYTKSRPEIEMGKEHDTIWVNTHGARGQLRRFAAGVKAAWQRTLGK